MLANLLPMATPRARSKQKATPAWAEALRERRMKLELSQEEVAARTGDALSQRTISALETGATPLEKVAISRVISLANALNWTLRQMQEATGIDLGAANHDGWTIAGSGPQLLTPIHNVYRVPVIGLASAGAPWRTTRTRASSAGSIPPPTSTARTCSASRWTARAWTTATRTDCATVTGCMWTRVTSPCRTARCTWSTSTGMGSW